MCEKENYCGPWSSCLVSLARYCDLDCVWGCDIFILLLSYGGLDPFVHHHIQLNQRGGAVSVYKCNRFLCVKFVSFNVTEFILMSSSSFLATSLGFSISCHLQTVRILLLLSNVDSSYLLFFSDCQLRTSKTMWNKKWWQWTSLPCSWSQKKCFQLSTTENYVCYVFVVYGPCYFEVGSL